MKSEGVVVVDVLFVADDDFANLGYNLNESLKSIGVNSVFIKTHYNSNYLAQGCIGSWFKKVPESKIIIFLHSIIKPIKNLNNKRIFVLHGGSRYRCHPEKYNQYFNTVVEKTIIQTADLLGLGAKNEVWVLPSIDVDYIKPNFNRVDQDKIVIGHFPSSVYGKNTHLIEKIINRLNNDLVVKNKFIYIGDRNTVSWEENIKRIKNCDICIDGCNSILIDRNNNNKILKFGEWGMTSLEAAAAGVVVVTHFLSYDKYEKEYGSHPLQISNSGDELFITLKRLILTNYKDLLQIKQVTRKWVEDNHSYRPVGERIFNKVFDRRI